MARHERAEVERPKRPRRKKRGPVAKALPYLGMLLGLAILVAYPLMEWSDARRREAVTSQVETVTEELPDERKEELMAQAIAYNDVLAGREPSVDEILDYEDQLSLTSPNIAFGTLVIPKIGLKMPLYHGTSEAVLSAGAGHVEGTALPVGGEGTHCVISAHSGLSNMAAFDDIRLLEPGDIFGVKVLGEYFCYEVVSTEVVEPDAVEALEPVPGADMMTLLTCTPYGVNSHRLLVHGVRCEVPVPFEEADPDPLSSLLATRNLPMYIGAGVVALTVASVVRTKRRRKARQAPRAAHLAPTDAKGVQSRSRAVGTGG